MTQASRARITTRLMGDIVSVAAIVIALVNNHTIQWAIGVPVVLAIVGVGLRIEAALVTSRSDQAGP